MKRFEYKLETALLNIVFPEHRINDRKELLMILLETVRYVLIEKPIHKNTKLLQKFVLYVDDMQRVFYFNNHKYYSIALPFSLHIMNNDIGFTFCGTRIDSELISIIISVLQSDNYISDSPWDLVEILDENKTDHYNIWEIFKYLMTYDLGYLRFDQDDFAYQEAKQRGAPNSHPECHIDVNFSNASTYKCGLRHRITQQEFIDIVDNKKDCWFLHNSIVR